MASLADGPRWSLREEGPRVPPSTPRGQGATDDGTPKPTPGDVPPSSPSDRGGEGGTAEQAAVQATSAGAGPPGTVTSSGLLPDRTAVCSGCKTHQRPGFLCPDCGRFVRFPVDKYPGQTNWIPF